MTLNHDEIQAANQRLRQADPSDIIRWAVGLGRKTIASTSFGVNSCVLLHMISETCPRLPVIWVDSGYNTADTYKVAEVLTSRLQTHLHTYTPLMTSERRQAIEGAIPTLDEVERHADSPVKSSWSHLSGPCKSTNPVCGFLAFENSNQTIGIH